MSLTKATYSMIHGAPINLIDYGVDTTGVNDSTAAIQAAVDALGALGQGRLVGPSGASYKITDTIDFTILGNTHNWYDINFAGAEFTWYGSDSGADPMFYFYANKAVKVQNFTLFAKSTSTISATVKGIRIDSLQPGGADLLVFSDFRIRLANICIDLGSTTGGGQNRVSDCRFEHFLLEGSSTGVQTNSTNCDSLIFTNGQLSGCATGFNFVRAGFNKIDTCIGYACDPFINIAGPIGPLTVINSQSEPETLPVGAFLYRKIYESARDGVITLVGCNINEKIFLDYDPLIGSDIQTLNLVGGYFTDLAIDAPDSVVNLIGANQFTGGVLTIAGTNSRCFNEGSRIGGTIVDTAGGYRLVSSVDGSFTPTVVGTTTAGTVTYVARAASFTRLADLCYFQIQLEWSGGTGTGNLSIAGLPYTSANNATKAFGTAINGYTNNIAVTAGNYITGFVPANSTNITLVQQPTGGGASTAIPYDAAGELVISGWYKVA